MVVPHDAADSMRHYAPNTEPLAVLACGCLADSWGAFKMIGTPGEWQGCETHPDGEGKWGMQKILREANPYEVFVWRAYRTPGSRRRSSKAHNWVRAMSGQPQTPDSESQSASGQQRLF